MVTRLDRSIIRKRKSTNSSKGKDARSKPRNSFDFFIFSHHAVRYLRNADLRKRMRHRRRNTNAKKPCKEEDQARRRKRKGEKKTEESKKFFSSAMSVSLNKEYMTAIEEICFKGWLLDLEASHSFTDLERFVVKVFDSIDMQLPNSRKLFTRAGCCLFILMIEIQLLGQDPRFEKTHMVLLLRRLPEFLETVVSQGIVSNFLFAMAAPETSSDSDSELSDRKPTLCLPPLPSELDNLVYDYAITNPEDSEEVLFREDTIHVEHYRFECLGPKLWLNDSIIDAFSRVCSLRDRSKPLGSPKTWFLPTFLANRWMGTCNFSSHYHGDYKDMGKIFLPCNVGGVHWVGICVDFLNKTTFLLDSIKEYCSLEWAQDKVSWLQTLLHYKFPSDHQVDINEFPIVRAEWLPEQPNSYDCGVYVCVYMDFLEKVIPKPDVAITFNPGIGRTYVCSRLISDPNNKMGDEIIRYLKQRHAKA